MPQTERVHLQYVGFGASGGLSCSWWGRVASALSGLRTIPAVDAEAVTARRANRIDGNHRLITDTFRAAGCSVQSLAEVGRGCPDLLIGVNKQTTFVVEVKDPAQPDSKRGLRPSQQEWHAKWRGASWIVETSDQALRLVDHYRTGK